MFITANKYITVETNNTLHHFSTKTTIVVQKYYKNRNNAGKTVTRLSLRPLKLHNPDDQHLTSTVSTQNKITVPVCMYVCMYVCTVCMYIHNII